MTETPSPRLVARTTGVLYLVLALVAPFAQIFVRSSVIVRGDAAAVAGIDGLKA